MEAADEGDAEARGSARAVSANMQTIHDPTISSYYVNDDLYRNLVENFTDWQREELAIAAPAVPDRFRLLLERESRLLDELSFDEWLAKYSPPATTLCAWSAPISWSASFAWTGRDFCRVGAATAS